jgi:protein tyrosine phosphatase (PTP) superfamily phosphohydrolase (DUF442 family)
MQIPSLRPALAALTAPAVPRPKRGWRRRAVLGLLLGVGLAFAAEAGRILFWGNTHTVVPGRVYRSAQLSPADLRDFIRKHGIRTVVNLRGCCAGFDWYTDECRVTHELNVAQEDITLSANRLPTPSEIRRLIEVFDRAEYPIVLHCRQGSDRTGLAAAIYLLLHTDADLRTARRQISERYAHFEVLTTANMDLFFHMYERWLVGRPHAPEQFRAWALHDYRADPAPARLELLGEVPSLRVGEAVTLRVRATNLSNSTWEFKPGTCAAVHLRYVVTAPDGGQSILRAGRFEAKVPPGGSIDLALPLPPFHAPGKCLIIADMADRNLNFCQLGSEWLELEIPVTAPPGR